MQAGGHDQWTLNAINNGTSHLNTVEGFVGHQGVTFSKLDERDIAPGFHHVAMVRNRATDELIMYIDGLEVAKNTGTPDVDVNDALGNFVIGGDDSASPMNKPFQGTIDFVRISDVALAPADFMLVDVPEPASLALLVIGGVLMLRRRSC